MKLERLPVVKVRPVLKYVVDCPDCGEEFDRGLDETDFRDGHRTMQHDSCGAFDARIGDETYLILETERLYS